MRILYLSEAFPFPLTSGYLRHYHFIRQLSARHSITLASLVNEHFQAEHREALGGFTQDILTFPKTRVSGRRRTLAGRAFGKIFDSFVPDSAVRAMAEAVRRLTRSGRFDLVFFSGRDDYPAVADIAGVPMIADICDAAASRLRATARFCPWRRRLTMRLDGWRFARIERALVKRAAHVLFASSRDRDLLLATGARHASVVPNGVDVDYWRRRRPELGRNTIVLTGAMGYQPNWDAALELIRHILPQVRRSVADAKLLVVGCDPPEELVAAGREPGVTVTGWVEDVRPYLEQSTVFAAPLRMGAGIQNKLLEAMAMELPVVASHLAAAGIRTEEGQAAPIEVAEGREQFARALIEQLARRAASTAPDSRARDFVQRHFTWTRSGEKLEAIIEAVRAPRTRSADAGETAARQDLAGGTPAPQNGPLRASSSVAT